MPNERTVMLLIKAQNATGEALKAVQGDIGKVGEAATKMGEKTEKGFMQGIRGAMSFLRQIRGIYFIIAGLVIGMILKLAQPVNEYEKTLKKMSETANLTGKDIARLAEIVEKQGRAMGMGTLALATVTGDVESASNSYASIMDRLKGMYEKMMPAMNSQETILKNLGVDFDGLYRAMQGPIELIEVFGNKGLTARDAYILFGEKFAEVLKLLNMSPEALKKMQDEMDEAATKTLANKEKMREYEQAVKDLHGAWDDFRATVGPIVLELTAKGLTFFAKLVTELPATIEEGMRKLSVSLKYPFMSERELNKMQEFQTPTAISAFVGPPAPAPAVPGVLPPEQVWDEELVRKYTDATVTYMGGAKEGSENIMEYMSIIYDEQGKMVTVVADSVVELGKKIAQIRGETNSMQAKLDAVLGSI